MVKFEVIYDGIYEYTKYEGRWHYYRNVKNSQRTPIYKEIIEGDIIGITAYLEHYNRYSILKHNGGVNYIYLCEPIDVPIEVIAKLALE